MENHNLYYQESKKLNPIGFAIAYAIYLVVALVLGYIYSVITTIVPFVYLNVVITIGLGLILGFVIRITVRLTHNRNKRSQYIQAFALGFLVSLFQWVTYMIQLFAGDIPSLSMFFSNLFEVVLPQNFFPMMATINKVGVWSIFGVTLNGFWLGFIWVFETIIIISMPIVAVYHTKVYPYSELLRKWYPKYTLIQDFESVSTLNQLEKRLSINSLVAIQDLGKGTGYRHSKIHLFYHKNETRHYLTIEKVYIEGRGTGKKKSELVVNNFEINKGAAQSILDSFESKKERIDIL